MFPLRIFLFALIFISGFASAEEPLLTRCVDVQALPREEAARGLPVAVRGVVTLTFAGPRNSFVVDDGRGVFVALSEADEASQHATDTGGRDRFEVGTVVDIRGVTGRGRFAAVIVPHEIKAVGTAPLPPFRPMSVSATRNGNMDCQGIELAGVVQRSVPKDPKVPGTANQLEVVAQDGRFIVVLRDDGGMDVNALVDAEVRVRGVATTIFNPRGESMGIRLQVQSMDSIVVTRPAPSDPFDAPRTTTRTLFPFSLKSVNLHRQRLAGTVTLSRPGKFFYVVEDGRAVRVNTNSPDRLLPGQRVEASGFVELVRYFAEVRDAVFRPLAVESPPAPLRTTAAEILAAVTRNSLADSDVLDGRLVQLRGRLLKVDVGSGTDHRLVVDCGGRAVLALMDGAVPTTELEQVAPGSEIDVTGIAVLDLGANWPTLIYSETRDFQLLLRDATDVKVIAAPSWWTPKRLWVLIGGVVALLAIVLAWNSLLRRRVSQRSAQLAAEMQARTADEIEFNATQRERTRMAADLHDTLEQALTGLAFQLDATRRFAPPLGERGTQHFELSRQLLASSREDLRRSLWNLRVQGLEGRTFSEALRVTAERSAAGRDAEIVVEEIGGPKSVPEFTAGHLLLLAQEAITNALKHARAKRIGVRVAYENGQVSMTIEDDGEGFDTAKSPGLADGHFGLQGMRERVDRLDGTIEIESAPGRGTRIVVRVPSPAAVG